MAREKENFRIYIERLDKVFPDKEILTLKEISEFLGIDRRTVKKRYKIDVPITKVELARKIG